MSDTYLGASPAAIRHHYDVGNEFWRIWLDPTMAYSCAMWESPDDDLERAQRRKLDYHVEQAGAAGAARVLDIGCGWGAQIMHMVALARRATCCGTYSFGCAGAISARDRTGERRDPRARLERLRAGRAVRRHHLGRCVRAFRAVRLVPEEQVEAYRQFFSSCRSWLKPGGRLSLQTIAYGDIPRDRPLRDRFIVDEIFPESELPRLADIARAAEMELEIEKVRNDRERLRQNAARMVRSAAGATRRCGRGVQRGTRCPIRALSAHVRLFDGAWRVHAAAVDDAPDRFAGTLVAEVRDEELRRH